MSRPRLQSGIADPEFLVTMKSRDELRAAVLGYIERGYTRSTQPDEFEALALSVFRYQFARNEPYQRFCQMRGVSAGSISSWNEVPAVPTAAFKEAALICDGPESAEAVFRTSGTTQGAARKGIHYVRDLSLYRAAAVLNFRAHVLPEAVSLRMLILGPPPELAADSSLTWMLELVRRELGTDESAYYVDEEGLRADELLTTLAQCEARAAPACLLGTAAAFVHLLDELERRRRSFSMPAGSRIMETGGFKNHGSEIEREEFYQALVKGLGVSPFYCVAEYGMTEMCSQFYDNVLRERARGRSPAHRVKVVPPWVRTRVVDAETLEPLPPGELGVLRHFDLANLDSVSAIQTDDLGIEGEVAGGGGFEIVGRATGAGLRGCSLAIDEWLATQ